MSFAHADPVARLAAAASGSEDDAVSKLIQRDPLCPSLLSGWNAESGMGMLV